MNENYVYIVTSYDCLLDSITIEEVFLTRLNAYDYISKQTEEKGVCYKVERRDLNE